MNYPIFTKFNFSLLRRSFQFQKLTQSRYLCSEVRNCWKCNVTLSETSGIFCSKCNSIQKTPDITETDFFNLFGLQRQATIDLNDLTTKFRKIQSQIHPDKFTGKSNEEQDLSAEWSSLINKAYKILQGPLERGEYLLALHGVLLPEDNSMTDPEFLLEMMEKNKEVESASTNDDLLDLLTSLREEMEEASEAFATHYESGNLEAARARLIKMKYLTSIERSIKEKLLKLT